MQRIHGLVIRCDERLPGLASVSGTAPDVELTIARSITVAESPTTLLYRSTPGIADAHSVEVVRDARSQVCFRYSDGSSANVNLASNPVRIEAVIATGQTLEDFAAYLYGPILGFVLRARGVLALHASCVEVDGGAVLFVGESGTGKSTTAAFFSQHGHPVLSDDLTALRHDGERFTAHPAFDHLRLWAQSEEILFGRANALATITPTWDKLRFPLAGEAFVQDEVPVRGIYILDDPGVTPNHPQIRGMSPRVALLALTTLTYANYLLDGSTRALELSQLGALVAAVPVHWLAAHLEGSHIGALRERVVAHLRSQPWRVPA